MFGLDTWIAHEEAGHGNDVRDQILYLAVPLRRPGESDVTRTAGIEDLARHNAIRRRLLDLPRVPLRFPLWRQALG